MHIDASWQKKYVYCNVKHSSIGAIPSLHIKHQIIHTNPSFITLWALSTCTSQFWHSWSLSIYRIWPFSLWLVLRFGQSGKDFEWARHSQKFQTLWLALSTFVLLHDARIESRKKYCTRFQDFRARAPPRHFQFILNPYNRYVHGPAPWDHIIYTLRRHFHTVRDSKRSWSSAQLF